MEFSQSSNLYTSDNVKEVGVHLLEEAWFFGNSLDTKTKVMSRCYSDPCPCLNSNQEILLKKSKNKIPKNSDEFVQRGLIRTPSLPNSLGMGAFSRENERFSGEKKTSSCPKLARAPSLPPCIVTNEEDEDDQESEFTMGRLIRQASLNSSHMLPPRQNSKVMTQSISIPRQHQMKKAELQSTNMEDCKDQRNQNPIQIKQNNPIDVEFEDLKGFKELGFKIEKEDINPKSMVNMIPAGVQQKNRADQLGERKLRKKQQQPWLTKSYSPPPSIPGWVDKRSAEDLKAQIKFWARAVASNVRQEC